MNTDGINIAKHRALVKAGSPFGFLNTEQMTVGFSGLYRQELKTCTVFTVVNWRVYLLTYSLGLLKLITDTILQSLSNLTAGNNSTLGSWLGG